MDLFPHECEPLTELQEELLDVVDRCAFQVALPSDVVVPDEVEETRVAGRLLRQIGVRRRQRVGEICNRASYAFVEPSVDVVDVDVSATAVLDGLLGIPEPQVGGIELIQQLDVVIPPHLCKPGLHNCHVRPRRREGSHVLHAAAKARM